MNGTTGLLWQEALREGGYEHHAPLKSDYHKAKRFTRCWRKILGIIGLTPSSLKNMSILEVGCGGGYQLAQFAVNGCLCVGIDCSQEVLKRADGYISELLGFSKEELDIKFICEDILKFDQFDEQFDIVFQFSILEHFLEKRDRLNVLSKMFKMTKPGGWIISLVPNGIQPLRGKMKENKLGGYNIPEVDYDAESLSSEMNTVEEGQVLVVPHDIFGYLGIINDMFYVPRILFYYLFQLVPIFLISKEYVFKHSQVLIAIKRKCGEIR